MFPVIPNHLCIALMLCRLLQAGCEPSSVGFRVDFFRTELVVMRPFRPSLQLLWSMVFAHRFFFYVRCHDTT